MLKVIMIGLLALAQFAHAHRFGVVDGGGGEIGTSSNEEVRVAIKEALAIATNKNILQNPLTALPVISSIEKGKASYPVRILYFPFESKLGKELKQQIEDMQKQDPSRESIEKYVALQEKNQLVIDRPALIAATSIQVKDQCFDKYGVEKDASVEAFEIGSPICLSLKGLSRFPKSVLVDQILGLLVHESMHLIGEDENVAYEAQGHFLAQLPNFWRKQGLMRLEYETRILLTSLIAQVKFFRTLTPSQPEAVQNFAVSVGKIGFLIQLVMPAGQFNVAPFAKPEMAEKFTNILSSLVSGYLELIQQAGKDYKPAEIAEVLEGKMSEKIKEAHARWVELVWGDNPPFSMELD